MNLTGQQLYDQGIVFNKVRLDNIQQHSVDLNVIKINKVVAGEGEIPAMGKTKLNHYLEMIPVNGFWTLDVGCYDLMFAQACKIPNNQRLQIVHRSSVLRNGGQIMSGLFDAGFETDNMGAILFVHVPFTIELNARIATAYVTTSNEVEEVYQGQFNNDSQRK